MENNKEKERIFNVYCQSGALSWFFWLFFCKKGEKQNKWQDR
jgi:hypothetical protein